MSFRSIPISISGLASIYCSPTGRTIRDCSVLFVSAWGYEDLCSRKMQRHIAEILAEHGIPSLRFDYLQTGDSLDAPCCGASLDWSDDILSAATKLRKISGTTKLIIVSQGLGCLLAAQAVERGLDVEGIAYLAPVIRGKAYLRELAMWSTLIDDGLGLRAIDRKKDAGSIGGLNMPASVSAWVSSAKMSEFTHPLNVSAFVAARNEQAAQGVFADQLIARGVSVTKVDFIGYDALMLSPTQSKVPEAVVSNLVDWLKQQAGEEIDVPVPMSVSLDTSHYTPVYREEFITFGQDDNLVGVWTEPLEANCIASVVFNGSGYDRRSGWGRQITWLARELAAKGVASLRYDAANVGDSAPAPNVPDAVLYHDSQLDDARAALDYVVARNSTPIVMSGRCSGAYVALHSAAKDERVQAVVGVNPVVFYWEPGRSIDDALDMRPRTLGEYKSRVLSFGLFKRIIRREVNISAALTNLCKAVWGRYSQRNSRKKRLQGADGKAVFGMFDAIASKRIKLFLAYSESDAGLDNFQQYFEDAGAAAKRYPNLTLSVLPNADHNLSSDEAREYYLQTILAAVDSIKTG